MNYCYLCNKNIKGSYRKHEDTQRHMNFTTFWFIAKELDAFETKKPNNLRIKFIFNEEGIEPVEIIGTKENYHKYYSKFNRLYGDDYTYQFYVI